jgi:hypothetical protein
VGVIRLLPRVLWSRRSVVHLSWNEISLKGTQSDLQTIPYRDVKQKSMLRAGFPLPTFPLEVSSVRIAEICTGLASTGREKQPTGFIYW